MEAPEEITGACSLPRTRRKIVIKIRPDTKWKNAEEKDEVPAPSSSPMASQSANPATAGVYYFNKRKLEEKLNVLATIQGGSEKLSTLSDSSSDEENGHGNFSLIEPLQSLNLSEQTSCDKDGLSVLYKGKPEPYPSFSTVKVSMDVVKPVKTPAAKKNRSE